jgi:hypothetical protein
MPETPKIMRQKTGKNFRDKTVRMQHGSEGKTVDFETEKKDIGF